MNELCLRVVAKVVVTEERVAADLMSNLERHFVKRLLVSVEADSNCAVYDEVHLQNFLFFVVENIFNESDFTLGWLSLLHLLFYGHFAVEIFKLLCHLLLLLFSIGH